MYLTLSASPLVGSTAEEELEAVSDSGTEEWNGSGGADGFGCVITDKCIPRVFGPRTIQGFSRPRVRFSSPALDTQEAGVVIWEPVWCHSILSEGLDSGSQNHKNTVSIIWPAEKQVSVCLLQRELLWLWWKLRSFSKTTPRFPLFLYTLFCAGRQYHDYF